MKNSKLKDLFSFFILIIALNSSIACFRSKRQSGEDKMVSVTANNYANRTSIVRTLVEIASSRTCNKTVEPEKEEVYCYHNGKCQSKLVPVNETHYERVIFCLCSKYFSGDTCLADDSFLLGGSNVFIIIFFCFAGFICISFVLYHAYYKIPNQQKKIETAQKKSRPIQKIPKETISSSNASDTANENLLASNNNDFHLIESNINLAKVKKNDLVRLTSSLSTQTGEIIGNLNQDRDNRKISLISENSKESQKSDNPDAVKTIAPSKIAKPTASSKAKIVKSEKKQVNIKLKKKENSESSD